MPSLHSIVDLLVLFSVSSLCGLSATIDDAVGCPTLPPAHGRYQLSGIFSTSRGSFLGLHILSMRRNMGMSFPSRFWDESLSC
ncbi:hypothetical protein BC826DRAFT_1023413 [Russula brevipes]|nr:hypothetical protein BC826DRAFT_1023413 [Russula brevipes]